MTKVSILERRNRWKEFKQQCVRLITEALLLLRERSDLIKNEWTLNRLLYQCIVDANYNLGLDFIPSPEAKNPPYPDDKQKAKSEDNIPDFSWPLMDPTASYQHWNRNFSLECKRLGIDKNRELAQEYVTEGILRFFSEEEGYGKGCEEGAMAGYIHDMELDTLLDKVNLYIAKHRPSIPLLATPTNGWQTQGVSYIAHSFQRTFVPLDFYLQHFWVDLRDCYFISPATSTESSSSEQRNLDSPKTNNKNKAQKQKLKQKTSVIEAYQIALLIDEVDSQ
jgi:hypothetical protein